MAGRWEAKLTEQGPGCLWLQPNGQLLITVCAVCLWEVAANIKKCCDPYLSAETDHELLERNK